jgi:tyrosyl-tRNA synthetase
MSLIPDLRWRGMIQDITPGTEEQLSREMTSGYIGFDPTAESAHWKPGAHFAVSALAKSRA